jgi:hypothetical protein
MLAGLDAVARPGQHPVNARRDGRAHFGVGVLVDPELPEHVHGLARWAGLGDLYGDPQIPQHRSLHAHRTFGGRRLGFGAVLVRVGFGVLVLVFGMLVTRAGTQKAERRQRS